VSCENVIVPAGIGNIKSGGYTWSIQIESGTVFCVWVRATRLKFSWIISISVSTILKCCVRQRTSSSGPYVQRPTCLTERRTCRRQLWIG